jgi:phosphoribosylformylglycinamidine synthase
MMQAQTISQTDKQKPGKQDFPVLCLAVVPKKKFDAKVDIVQFPLYWITGEFTTQSSSQAAPQGLDAAVSVLQEILTDPLQEDLLWAIDTSADRRSSWARQWHEQGFALWAERQFLPGVTDNLGKTIEEALTVSGFASGIKVASGAGFLFGLNTTINYPSLESLIEYCRYKHFHPLADRFVVHELDRVANEKTGNQDLLTFPRVNLPAAKPVEVISLDLNENQLETLSKERLLALSASEMQAIKKYYEDRSVQKIRQEHALPKWPTDVELEIIAQTWSEHCKHKIFNATINFTNKYASDGDLPREKCTVINSLYKTYIQAATEALKPKRSDLLSVFVDNAGVVRWNNKWAVCFKVETHNSPSALEPYGGALTGILGVNRDVLGTGLGAKPLFNTDVFCFAYPHKDLVQRQTMLPPEAIIAGVRKGVEDGGNKSGIATVNGALYFHPGYRAKPLVYCGTGGILPLEVEIDKKKVSGVEKHTQPGDTIVMVGGRVGKDGIHGATFSSEALHEGSPVSAVQIGDPFTQKRVLDFVIEARDLGLITGITDNGAGGLSSSVGEMAEITSGALLNLDNVPLKYPGLAAWEIVVSEAQERMTISTRRFAELKELAVKHRVEVTDIGGFDQRGKFEIVHQGKTVAMLDLKFLHKGAPKMMLEAEWSPPPVKAELGSVPNDLGQEVLQLLSDPNICSREAIIRQYDHEVQGLSVIKPLMGAKQQAPCDAAVIKVLYDDDAGLVVSNGICPQYSQYDAYLMALCAVDEAVRNAVCVGADPESLSILDNFCWPDPVHSARNADGKEKLGQLVRACQGLYDAAIAYSCPLISGKDSMKNDFDDGTVRLSIPPTLLISAMGRIPSVDKAISMDFKSPGDSIYLLSAGTTSLAGSQYAINKNWTALELPTLDLVKAKVIYKILHEQITNDMIKSCHDLSEGGLAIALAECIIGSGLGATVSLALPELRYDAALFAEGPGRLLVTIDPVHESECEKLWGSACLKLGQVSDDGQLKVFEAGGAPLLTLGVEEMTSAWKTSLPID